MLTKLFCRGGESPTAFDCGGEDTRLVQLFGMPCETASSCPWVKGSFSLETDRGVAQLKGTRYEITEDGTQLTSVFEDPCLGLRLVSRWSFCEKTGVMSRKDSLTNISDQPIVITRCLARFSLAQGTYDLYSQSGRWCAESEGGWQRLSHGGIVLASEGARTAQGATPYLCIREVRLGAGAVFHVLPKGNWVMKVFLRTGPGDTLPSTVIDAGLSDEHLRLPLRPGQALELPEILIQELFDGQPQRSAPRLHRYMLGRLKTPLPKAVPVVYNTWFDAFDDLKVQRLEEQLTAAKEVGCDIFTIDAGWYGQMDGDWSAQAGDWREKLDGAFQGKMTAFANRVRAEGLGFGLWMEPERLSPKAPIRVRHPQWFFDAGNGYFYPDLENSEVVTYLQGEILRLIDTYQLAWMKLDFNIDLGIDPHGHEFLGYYEAWYRILREVRKSRPQLFIEGCASGGMRLELTSQSSYDAHFLTDTVYPPDVLRIFEGTLLRTLPGRLTKWAVMRPGGQLKPTYGVPLEKSPEIVITPCDATWSSCQSADIDFILFSALPGVPGLGGDIAGLKKSAKSRIREFLSFFKKYRYDIYNGFVQLLTPLTDKESPRCWKVFQVSGASAQLLFVYRLYDAGNVYPVRPVGLDPFETYRVEYWDGELISAELEGKALLEQGITVRVPERYGATAVVLKPRKAELTKSLKGEGKR